MRTAGNIPLDPNDKSTVVSIYPRVLFDRKVSLFPGVFKVEPGYANAPATLTLGPSHWMLNIPLEDRSIAYPVSSYRVATAFVQDKIKAFHCYTPDAMPGVFVLHGVHDSIAVLKNNVKEIKEAAEKQKRWYEALVKEADVLWARTNGNPLAISNDARLAAEQLQLGEGKTWMQDFKTLQMTNCPACGVLRNGNFPICGNCRTILDPKKYKEMGLAAAS